MSWPNREKEKKKYVYVQLLTAKILLGAERRGGLGTLYIGMTEAFLGISKKYGLKFLLPKKY